MSVTLDKSKDCCFELLKLGTGLQPCSLFLSALQQHSVPKGRKEKHLTRRGLIPNSWLKRFLSYLLEREMIASDVACESVLVSTVERKRDLQGSSDIRQLSDFRVGS